MNTKHTPAPWNRDLEAIKGIMGRFRIQVYRKGLECISVISGKNKKEVEANAERIVQCVNAMEGLTNEQVADIRSQNTELLEALIHIKSLCGKTYPTNEAIFRIANNAIKKQVPKNNLNNLTHKAG